MQSPVRHFSQFAHVTVQVVKPSCAGARISGFASYTSCLSLAAAFLIFFIVSYFNAYILQEYDRSPHQIAPIKFG